MSQAVIAQETTVVDVVKKRKKF
jgi:hypothetical protein